MGRAARRGNLTRYSEGLTDIFKRFCLRLRSGDDIVKTIERTGTGGGKKFVNRAASAFVLWIFTLDLPKRRLDLGRL